MGVTETGVVFLITGFVAGVIAAVVRRRGLAVGLGLLGAIGAGIVFGLSSLRAPVTAVLSPTEAPISQPLAAPPPPAAAPPAAAPPAAAPPAAAPPAAAPPPPAAAPAPPAATVPPAAAPPPAGIFHGPAPYHHPPNWAFVGHYGPAPPPPPPPPGAAAPGPPPPAPPAAAPAPPAAAPAPPAAAPAPAPITSSIPIAYNAPPVIPLTAPSDFRLIIVSGHALQAGDFNGAAGNVQTGQIPGLAIAVVQLSGPATIVLKSMACQQVTASDNPTWDWQVTPSGTEAFDLTYDIYEVKDCTGGAPLDHRVGTFPVKVAASWWARAIYVWPLWQSALLGVFSLVTAAGGAIGAWSWVRAGKNRAAS